MEITDTVKITQRALAKAMDAARRGPASSPILEDIANPAMWREALIRSGHTIATVPPPEKITFDPTWDDDMKQYQRDRIAAINAMPIDEVSRYCRAYKIRLHGRLIPDFI